MAESSATSPFGIQDLNSSCGVDQRLLAAIRAGVYPLHLKSKDNVMPSFVSIDVKLFLPSTEHPGDGKYIPPVKNIRVGSNIAKSSATFPSRVQHLNSNYY